MHLTLNFNFAAYSQKNDYEVKRWTAKRKVGRINWKSKILEKKFFVIEMVFTSRVQYDVELTFKKI